LCYYGRLINKSLLQVWSLCIFHNFRYLSKYFAQIYRAQYGAAILVYLCDTPTWQPQNSVIIFNLLWLSGRLITCTEETSIYISTFPNTLTSTMAKYHEIRGSKQLSWKGVHRYKFTPLPLMSNEDKNISGSFILDLRKLWCHMQVKNSSSIN